MAIENKFDVIIIGGGAAGFMCAAQAGKRGRKTAIIEHAEKVGKKISISGGGRCNFTNLTIDAGNYVSENPHFCKSALSRYTQHDFISLVEKYNVPYHEKTLGQLFCDGRSQEIIDILLNECRAGNVSIKTGYEVNEIRKDEGFIVSTDKGDFETESVVIATGGLSIPKMGATDLGYIIAEKFGLNIIAPRPALVPFIIDKRFLLNLDELAGVSFDAVVTCNKKSFRESVLFTHKGLSGPAILQISIYWNHGDSISINLLPGIDLEKELRLLRTEQPAASVKSVLNEYLPKRLIQKLDGIFFNSKPAVSLSDKEIKSTAAAFHNWIIFPSCTEGFEKAEVTAGGVDTNEISSKTFESKKVKGLYFIGEVLDVTGWLGGYNFQWAWSSGYCAGQYV